MKFTVIFEDGVLVKNGVPVFTEPFTPPDDNWRVIQWNGGNGYIEVYLGDRIWLSDLSVIEPYLTMYDNLSLVHETTSE